MTRTNFRLAILLVVIVLLCSAPQTFGLSGVSTGAPLSQAGWRLELEEGKTGRSTLTINNRCSEPHLFRVKNKVKYLRFEQPTDSVLVGAKSSRKLGVQFNAAGLKSKLYRDKVIVDCLDCKKEPGCAQERDEVAVELNVTKPNSLAQPPMTRSETALGRVAPEERMIDIAKQLPVMAQKANIRVDGQSTSFVINGGTLLATALVADSDKLNEAALEGGANISFVYVSSPSKKLPSGYYALKVAKGGLGHWRASLVSSDRKEVASLPVDVRMVAGHGGIPGLKRFLVDGMEWTTFGSVEFFINFFRRMGGEIEVINSP